MAPLKPLMPFEKIKTENSIEDISSTKPKKSEASQNESELYNKSKLINKQEDDLKKQIEEIVFVVNNSDAKKKKYFELKNNSQEQENQFFILLERAIQYENYLISDIEIQNFTELAKSIIKLLNTEK